MKPIIIAICGKSATGKDTLLKRIAKSRIGATVIVSDTTRPPREGETDGQDYNFKKTFEFVSGIRRGKYLEWTTFRNWFYGTPEDSVCGKINVGVFNPAGIKSLSKFQDDYEIIPVYLVTSLGTRIKRYVSREGKWSWELPRRLLADFKDFFDFKRNILSLFPQFHIMPSNGEDDLRFAVDILETDIKTKELHHQMSWVDL